MFLLSVLTDIAILDVSNWLHIMFKSQNYMESGRAGYLVFLCEFVVRKRFRVNNPFSDILLAGKPRIWSLESTVRIKDDYYAILPTTRGNSHPTSTSSNTLSTR